MTNTQLAIAITELQRKYRKLCCEIECCLGISNEGDSTLFLNQQGDWVSGGGGGGGTNIYNSDGTQSDANRIYDGDGKNLFFNDLGAFQVLNAGSFTLFTPYIGSITAADVLNLTGTLISIDGSPRLSLYPDTRDDSGTTTPINFLYTDALGNLLSAPYSGGGGNNLANSDLTQTDAVRIYDANNSILGFINIDQGGFIGNKMNFQGNDTEINGNTRVRIKTTDTGEIRIETPAIVNTTATNGQVLTLIDSSLGTVEWQSLFPIRIEDYGGTYILLASGQHLNLEGAGTGTTTVDISALAIGNIVIISDLDFKAGANNITIDAGTGNTITSLNGMAQIYTITNDGESVTIQRVTSTKFKMI